MDNVLLRLQRPSPRLPARSLLRSWSGGHAAALHAIVAALLLALRPSLSPLPVDQPRAPAPRVTWIVSVPDDTPGLQRGGGGGGSIRRPARATPQAGGVSTRAPADDAPLKSARIALAAPVSWALPHAFMETSEGISGGEGIGGGSGDGEGDGIGSGNGPGVGTGSGGGTGGMVYRPGGGVTAPVVVTQVRPTYPEQAMTDRVQGSVTLDVIVRRDGTADVVRVVRSVDRGPLDAEAARAVANWRFRPGRRNGVAVDVLVTVIIDFVLY